MENGSERVSVQTYVPAYQKELWAEDADRMGVSQSEFVRMMVQAGRSKFELSPSGKSKDRPVEANESEQENEDPFRERLLKTLSPDEPLDWDELVDALTQELESELDQTLEELQQDNEVRYSGRQGGYIIREDHEE